MLQFLFVQSRSNCGNRGNSARSDQKMQRASRAALNLAVTLFCATGAVAFAETADINSTNPSSDTIVVTGSRIEVKSSDSPISTEVLGGEELEAEHIEDLTEAVEKIPSVFVQDNPRRSGQSASMQGLSGKHVLVLVDGVPLTQNANAGFDLNQIDPYGIQQVEVVKGGASALYGSQAMGGVINVITKSPTSRLSYYLDANSGYIANNKDDESGNLPNNIKAGVSGREQNTAIGYQLQFSRRARPAFDLDTTTITKDGAESERYNGSLKLDRYFGDSHKLSAKYLRYQEDTLSTRAQLSPLAGYQAVEDSTETVTQQALLDYTADIDDDRRFNTKLSYEWTTDRLRLNDNPLTDFVENEEYAEHGNLRWDTQYDQPLFDHHVLTSGLLIYQQSLNQNSLNTFGQDATVTSDDVDNKKLTSLEAFIQDSIIFDSFSIVPGARAQYDSDFGLQFSPKVSSHLINDLSEKTELHTRLSVGTGYRVPNLKERYYFLDHRAIAGYVVKGNNQLKPEESVNIQGSSEVLIGRNHSIRVGAYLNFLRGLIEVAEPDESAGFTRFEYQNIERARTKGLELSATTRVLSNWSLTGYYGYLEPENLSKGLFLPLRPFYSARISSKLSVLNRKLDLTTTARYLGRQYANEDNTEVVPAHIVTDLKANWRVYPSTKLYFGVDNIFDVKKSPAADTIEGVDIALDPRPARGRYIYLGINIQG